MDKEDFYYSPEADETSTRIQDDKPREECGLFGVINHPEAYDLTIMGLFALQHRGEESSGIAVADNHTIKIKAGLGHVKKVFQSNQSHKSFNSKGSMSIGHTRYSITGSSSISRNTQPIVAHHSKGSFAVAHNGNLTNAKALKLQLEQAGSIFQTSMDSEILLHLIARSKHADFKNSIIEALQFIEGAFSFLIITHDTIYAVRDPHGFRPLCFGKLDENIFSIASESCALDLIGAKYMGQVHAGEIYTFNHDGKYSRERYAEVHKENKCIFEMIYFARPDSLIFGESVYNFRKEVGRILAREAPPPDNAQMVIPIPDSGNYAALGYASASNLPFEIGITRNHYIGRSFIQPKQTIRALSAKIKLNPIKNLIHKKSIVLVDDSIVRGTTTKKKIIALKNCGTKEIHLRIASPPIVSPCFYGVDFPNRADLIACQKNIQEMQKFLEVDSLVFVSLDGILKASHNDKNSYCKACFTGKYPTKVHFNAHKEHLHH